MMFGIVNALLPRHWRELYRHFRNFNYEYDDKNNLLISHAKIGGVYETFAPDGLGWVATPNLITTEGANHLLSVGVAGGSQVGPWYVAPFSGNVTVADTWVAATFAATATELTSQYSESTRVAFTESVPASKSTNNTANPATFTAASDNVNIWGVGLLSSSTKGGTSGTLLSAAKYSSVRNLPTTGDTIAIKYTLTLANS
jgi:hypothetical protein